MAETSIYQKGSVTITSSKVMFGGTSYFLRNIASVRVVQSTQGGHILLLLVGMTLFSMGLSDIRTMWVSLLLGLGLAFWAFKLGFRRHTICFDSSSGSVNAYHGPADEVQTIKGKIEEAMSAV